MRRDELDPIEFEEQHPASRMVAGFELFVLLRLAVAVLAFVVGLFMPNDGIVHLILMLLCFLAAGYDVLLGAVMRLVNERSIDENLLITLASLTAFVVRLDSEGAAVMLVFRLCKLLLDYVIRRSRQNVMTVLDGRPGQATIILDDEEYPVNADEITAGDTVVLNPGDCACVDCIVLEGYSTVDVSAVTGSEQLCQVEEGETILAGSVNVSSRITAQAVSGIDASTSARVQETVFDEDNDAESFEIAVLKYSRIFAPIAVALCAVYAVLITLFGKVLVPEAIHRALIVLIVACPSGLLAAIRLIGFTGLSGAAHKGILFRGTGVMQALSRCKALIFDKTGTVTTSAYQVVSVHSPHMDGGILLKAAAHAAANASSASAAAIVNAYGGPIDYSIIGGFVEYPEGISVNIEGIAVLMGSRTFLLENAVTWEAEEDDGPTLHVALGGRYAGTILLGDTLQENASAAVSALESSGFEDVVLLAEDSSEKTRSLAQLSGISKYYSQCLPMDKLARVQEMCERTRGSGTVFVGGADADPALMAAGDVGMILGGLEGAAVNEADIIAMDGDVAKTADAARFAGNMLNVLRQSVLLVLAVKLVVLLLAVLGITNELWFAALLDGCACIAAALWSIRAFSIKK